MIGIGIAKKVGAIDGADRSVFVRGIDLKMKINRHSFFVARRLDVGAAAGIDGYAVAPPKLLPPTPEFHPAKTRLLKKSTSHERLTERRA